MTSFTILLPVTLMRRQLWVVKMGQLMYLTCTVGDALELSGKTGEICMTLHLSFCGSLDAAIDRLRLGIE